MSRPSCALPPREAAAFVSIMRQGRATSPAVAADLGTTRASAMRLIWRLEERGLVTCMSYGRGSIRSRYVVVAHTP